MASCCNLQIWRRPIAPIDPAPPEGHCDVCNGGLVILYPRVRDPQTGHNFGIWECVDCGLGQTLPAPIDIGPYYGPHYHGGRHGLTDRMCMARRIGWVKSGGDPVSLLDFGCGDGGFLEAAGARGWKATGVEVKPEHARSRVLQVFEDIDQLEGAFDVITLWHSLEHVHSPRRTLERLLPRLSDRGRIIVAVPNLDSLQARIFSENWFHLDVPRHLFHFRPRSLERLFTRNGLRVVQRWNLEAEIDLFGWTQSLLNYVIPNANVLFDVLTKRQRVHARSEIIASVALGTVLTAASAPLATFASLSGQGAVMIFAAERSGPV